ncbi:hypothetical protein ACFLSE_09105 [Bacteroidota bacterium]
MIKQTYFNIFFLSFILWSCEKDTQVRNVTCIPQDNYEYLDGYIINLNCTSDTCLHYFDIWKELFKEENNVNDAFIDEKIEICQLHLHAWKEGISFHICYKVTKDWAIAWNCDKFVVKLNKDSRIYPSLPRDEYLSKNDIKYALSQNRIYSQIGQLSDSDIKFSSLDQALSKLIEAAEVNTLCFRRVYLNDENGNFLLEASGEYVDEDNLCVFGVIDLITGKTEIHDGVCIIIN